MRDSKNMEGKDRIVDCFITIMGFHNDLITVGYGYGMHSTGTLFFRGAAYKYDESQNSGLCRFMNREGSPLCF